MKHSYISLFISVKKKLVRKLAPIIFLRDLINFY